jgi:K+-sensing histidine kinase KdpD
MESLKDEELLEVCTMIKESSDRLRKMAESSQLITQLKTDKLHSKIEPVRIGEVLDEIQMYYQTNFKNIAIEFTNKEICLNIDQYLIYKSLIILVDNAVKFTPDEETIVLKSEILEDKYIIKIIDNGPGFTEQYLNDQFKMFISDDIQFHAEGLGLGLSTVKLIMDYHEGGIRLENNKSKGSTAILIFQIEKEYNPDMASND